MRRNLSERLLRFCRDIGLCRIGLEADQRLVRGFEDSITLAISLGAIQR